MISPHLAFNPANVLLDLLDTHHQLRLGDSLGIRTKIIILIALEYLHVALLVHTVGVNLDVSVNTTQTDVIVDRGVNSKLFFLFFINDDDLVLSLVRTCLKLRRIGSEGKRLNIAQVSLFTFYHTFYVTRFLFLLEDL